jgi:hypothetical protein
MKDPTRAVARLLADLLKSCAHCGLQYPGHDYALLATWAITKQKHDALVSFFEAIKEHDWPKLREFQIWLGDADNVEAYAIRCSRGNLTVAVIKTHFELLQSPRLLYSEALAAEESNRLLHAFTDVQWYPF